jgi:hypothetical protein
MVVIRGFDPVDSPALACIFYDAVQTGAAGEYTQAERDAWCNAQPPDNWAIARFDGLAAFVALVDVPVGFMCCNQVKMSVVSQSRNVTLGGVVAWLGWVETSDIGALNSHAGVVILRHVLTLLLPFLSHV